MSGNVLEMVDINPITVHDFNEVTLQGIKMETKNEGDVTLVLVNPRFDPITAKEIETKLTAIVDGGAKKLLCDFSSTEYISSAGLRVMLSAVKKLQKSGGKMVLSCMQPFVSSVFKMAGFDQIFEICETKEQAMASLKRVSP